MENLNGAGVDAIAKEPMAVTAQNLVGYKPALAQLHQALGTAGCSDAQIVFCFYPDGSMNWNPPRGFSLQRFHAAARACLALADDMLAKAEAKAVNQGNALRALAMKNGRGQGLD